MPTADALLTHAARAEGNSLRVGLRSSAGPAIAVAASARLRYGATRD
jgi:hypothetical protein